MHIEDLIAEIEITFRDIPLEYIPARIAQLEEYRDQTANRLTRFRGKLAAGKKLDRFHMVCLRQDPRRIRQLSLIIRALKEGYAYRIA
jgi:hypothetical protein